MVEGKQTSTNLRRFSFLVMTNDFKRNMEQIYMILFIFSSIRKFASKQFQSTIRKTWMHQTETMFNVWFNMKTENNSLNQLNELKTWCDLFINAN